MRYAFQIGEKEAEVNCSDDLSIDELQAVKDMLSKLIDTSIQKMKMQMQNKLPLNADIDSLYPELSSRARNVLKRNGCKTIADVLNCTPTDLVNMRNMGKNTLSEIYDRFTVYGDFKEQGAERATE